MKTQFYLLLLLLPSLFYSCSNGTNIDNKVTDVDSTDFELNKRNPLPPVPDCQFEGKILEGNLIISNATNRIIAILANKETEDINFGESHRMLVVQDETTCREVFRKKLPVNRSPDFPYYLPAIHYNNVSHLAAIQGYDKIYVLDLENLQLSSALTPKYLKDRLSEDAQSGRINHLEVWENYLVGHSEDKGAFVFDLSEFSNIVPVLPIAEREGDDGMGFNALFLLSSKDGSGKQQALMPTYNAETEIFDLMPLFKEPVLFEHAQSPVSNGAFIVLRPRDALVKSVGVNLSKAKVMEVPDEIRGKTNTEVIQWLQRQPIR